MAEIRTTNQFITEAFLIEKAIEWESSPNYESSISSVNTPYYRATDVLAVRAVKSSGVWVFAGKWRSGTFFTKATLQQVIDYAKQKEMEFQMDRQG